MIKIMNISLVIFTFFQSFFCTISSVYLYIFIDVKKIKNSLRSFQPQNRCIFENNPGSLKNPWSDKKEFVVNTTPME